METADANDLRLLAIAHYALAGLTAASAAFFIPLAVFGWQWLQAAKQALAEPAVRGFEPGDQMIWGAAAFSTGVAVAALCLVHGAVLIYIGRCLANRRRRTLCLVFSAVHLINLPLGAVLSVFTFLVLRRPSVQAAFTTNRSSGLPA
ncbi:MAG TPA: hypothetical protein VHB99_19980 [Pirellulales bacterium]|nr:hypothetical protein [Pirellulales bacterium]